jgi:DNA-binding MarR family transcriptional regulator
LKSISFCWSGQINTNINKKLLAYIKYLREEDAINELYGLDSTQIKVLNAVIFAVYEKRDGRVGDLLLLKQIASPATIHAALKKLLARGLITLRKAPDSRAKYVELTELGLKRYNDLAKAAGK